jgi:hypothetical protein
LPRPTRDEHKRTSVLPPRPLRTNECVSTRRLSVKPSAVPATAPDQQREQQGGQTGLDALAPIQRNTPARTECPDGPRHLEHWASLSLNPRVTGGAARVEVWVSSPEPAIVRQQNLSRAPLASLRDRLRRPLTEPVCRQVRQLSGSGEGPGTGQGAARLPETGREMATRTRASRCRQRGATLSHGKPPRGSGRARPWRRPGRSQDRHQHSSGQQAVTGGARLLHDEAYLTSDAALYGVTTGPL